MRKTPEKRRTQKLDTKGIKQLGQNLYQIRVTRQDPRTGRRVERQAKVEGDLAEALRTRDRLREELHGEAEAVENPTLRAFAKSWLVSRVTMGRIEAPTAAQYARHLDLHIVPAIGDIRVAALRPSLVEPCLGTGWAGVNRLRLLRTMAKDALADGLTDRDFTARLHVPYPLGYDEDNPNLLSADELGKFLKAAREHEPRMYPAILLLGLTGLRWGEASALRWSDLEPSRHRIRIQRANWRGVVRPRPKTKKRRVVPMGPDLAEVLGAHRRRMVKEQHPALAEGWIFPLDEPRHLRDRELKPNENLWLHAGTPVRYAIERLCKRAGVTRITPHGLRRTFNDIGRRVTSRQVLQSITGHVTDEMTEHYSLVDDDERLEAQTAVARLTFGAEED